MAGRPKSASIDKKQARKLNAKSKDRKASVKHAFNPTKENPENEDEHLANDNLENRAIIE